MGLFSWDCKECGHPMLSEYATNRKNDWMNDVVVIESDGGILKGSYDGYGRVDEHELTFGVCGHEFTNEPCCYHNACWEMAGKPMEYEPSQSSADQGYFFDEGDHNMECPQ